MKKINILFLFLATLLLAVGCEDSPEVIINPEAEKGTLTFHLNDVPYGNYVYVLDPANATQVMETLTCMQPDYGFTAAVTYFVEASFSEAFPEDEYFALLSSTNGEKVAVNTKEMNRAMMQLYGEDLPETYLPVNVYLRLRAEISEAVVSPLDPEPKVKSAYSNSIRIKVLPYYMLITDALPAPYFLIGSGATGSWDNDGYQNVGQSMIPLSLVADYAYDAVTGAGEFTYTGYFVAGEGFKLIGVPGQWDPQWGNDPKGAINNPLYNEGDDFAVGTSDYYTVKLNSETNTLSIKRESFDTPPAEYTSIQLVGTFDGWGNNPVELTKNGNEHSHIWYGTVTITEEGADDEGPKGKFRANNSWDKSWGGNSFPYSTEISGGDIPLKVGTYLVVFNDLDGNYYFFDEETIGE